MKAKYLFSFLLVTIMYFTLAILISGPSVTSV